MVETNNETLVLINEHIEGIEMPPQSYPRIDDDESKYDGCLDISYLEPHSQDRIPEQRMQELFLTAIRRADIKSSREFFNIDADASEDEIQEEYYEAGIETFSYFRRYFGDPPESAVQVSGRNYRDVGIEQLGFRQLQRGRMNSGWRYQFFVVDCARECDRFVSVGDIGTTEGDFTSVMRIHNWQHDTLNLYVSVKNRGNTMGGQDWPGAIAGIEGLASGDRNRIGPYCCVFGIAMDESRNERRIPRTRDGRARSVNTEIWMSNFFWPFFTNYSYQEIMQIA